ncbi:MAG: CoA transferase [Spirochaetota bacterium]|nr:CoA transferase [Spirochaetota bacterium]
MAITKGPLSGIRIIDMSHAHAGPFGTMLLSDLGAEIIKLEPPTGDLMRFGMPTIEVNPLFFYILTLNRNKRSIILDITAEHGRKAFDELVKISDVVFSNFRSDVPKRQGTDYETLKKINPRIIRSNISGYGETGPYVKYPAFDIIACGHSGILSISGEPGSHPIIPGGIAMADMMGGIFAVMSVLAALVNRDREGRGAKVESSLLNSLLIMQKVIFQNYFTTGEKPGLQGRRHHMLPTYGIFETKDSFITLGPTDDSLLLKIVGLEWMLEDPKFSNMLDRLANVEEFTKHFEEALRQRTTDDWLKVIRDENNMASGPVLDYDQVANDPQVLKNEMITEIELKGKKYKTIASVFKMPGVIEGTPEPAPDHGQHTEEILKELLNYSDDMIQNIVEENKLGVWRMQERKAKK